MLCSRVTERPIITLTTDFGHRDAYVACMKGVILGIAPNAAIVDISHDVPPQDVRAASALLVSAYRYFPQATIHTVVVDPGVGTARRPVGVAASWGTYVGPDNGCLGGVLAALGHLESDNGWLRDAQAVELSNPDYRHVPVSRTFHGRDIFAPAAAFLACGVPLADMGPAVRTLVGSEGQRPLWENGVLQGTITHIDHFGNAITNILESALPDDPVFDVGGHTIRGLSRTYQDGDIMVLVGSTGFVEVAVRNGSAAADLGLHTGLRVGVRSSS
ncbi:MAG: hypothetical protein NVS2B16_06440 [Chloroflexota bacterium]